MSIQPSAGSTHTSARRRASEDTRAENDPKDKSHPITEKPASKIYATGHTRLPSDYRLPVDIEEIKKRSLGSQSDKKDQ